MNEDLHPAQHVYALAVNEANREYNKNLLEAHAKRKAAVTEAWEACLLAMKASTDEPVG